MTTYCFSCGFVRTVPSARIAPMRAAIVEHGLKCASRLHDMARIKPLQSVAVAWQDRMLEGVGMGETVKVLRDDGQADSNKAAVC